MDIRKIHIDGHKCFKSITLDDLKPINVIIGRNNIGKSSILDIIEMIYNVEQFANKSVKIRLEKPITFEEISNTFRSGHSGGGIPGDHFEFGKKFFGKEFIFEIYANNNRIEKRSIGEVSTYNAIFQSQYRTSWNLLAQNMSYKKMNTKRVLAERNIFPEVESELMVVDGNGNGITTIINNFINKVEYDESFVRTKLLNKLNEIMGEDANFTEIVTQQVKSQDSTKWEIFLREEIKGRISLSNSGSGLKTILMVLVYTILIPVIEKSSLENYIFMFEELENNLHPSLQRRLLKYIESLSKQGSVFFLTTHSNVLLDAYQNNSEVNVIHVIRNGVNDVNLLSASSNLHKNKILNDLGIKASDLLQANGIIWVEGPSDRIYINKWLQIWSENTLIEGKDYQCVFYGGRLLSHLTYDEQTEFINLIKVNRNSVILIDSDKDSQGSLINPTKKRIQDETALNNTICWITFGKEIENYLSARFIKKYYNMESKKTEFGQFDKIDGFLSKLNSEEGKLFLRNKIQFAKNIMENSSKDDFVNTFDLNEKLNMLVQEIKSWNNV